MTAWYAYPNINNYGAFPDPDGNFPKPDINFGVPDGVPITTLLPGTVSGINTPGNSSASPAWGQVVTLQLDQPWNSAATYISYLHLGSVSVQEGQHLNAGDTVGVAGADSMGEHYRVGLAFQSGPYYGFGSGFNSPGSPALNPTTLLNEALSGKITVPGGATTATLSATTSSALGGLLPQALMDWISDPARIAKMIAGVVLIGIALFFLISGNDTAKATTQKVGEAALKL